MSMTLCGYGVLIILKAISIKQQKAAVLEVNSFMLVLGMLLSLMDLMLLEYKKRCNTSRHSEICSK